MRAAANPLNPPVASIVPAAACDGPAVREERRVAPEHTTLKLVAWPCRRACRRACRDVSVPREHAAAADRFETAVTGTAIAPVVRTGAVAPREADMVDPRTLGNGESF